MNNKFNDTEHDKDLARFLSGEMDEREQGEFIKELDESPVEKKELSSLFNYWKAMEQSREPVKLDTQKAWNKLHARLDEDNLLLKDREIILPQRSYSYGRLLRIAAMVVILLGSATLIYYGFLNTPRTEMLQLSTSGDPNTMIKTLTDGSVIYLAQNTTFTYPKEFGKKSREVKLEGEAFFDIAPDAARPFIIETGRTKIQVLGTAFNVRASGQKDFELVVNRGKVKVTLEGISGASELVVAGEKVITSKDHLVKSKCTEADIKAWYRLRMQFKDEPLQNILSVLNRNFNTTFAAANKEIGNRKLAVTFQNESAATMTELICLALNLKSQMKNDSIILSDNISSNRGR